MSKRARKKISNVIEYHDVQSSDAVRMGEIFNMPPGVAGISVTERTAMQVSTVYACVRLLAGSVAMLPIPVYEENEQGERIQRKTNNLWRLLNAEPNLRWSAASMWEFIVSSVLLRGDGYVWIDRIRNANNEKTTGIQGLYPAHPDDVTVRRKDGLLLYTVTDNGETWTVDQSDMLHFPGFGFNGVQSMSVIRHGAMSAIGIAAAADQHSGAFMHSGGSSKYVVMAPKKMDPAQQQALRESFARKYSGPTNEPLVLTEGLDVKTISMSAQDAQMLESRRFQVEDIARAFGVPPFMVGATEKVTSWGSGVEQMGRGYLIYTLNPHLTRFEQELNRKLLNSRGNKYVEFMVDGLARADQKTRHDAYRQAIGGSMGPGWMTVDEVRQKERLPALGGKASELYSPTDSSADGANTGEENEGSKEDIQPADA